MSSPWAAFFFDSRAAARTLPADSPELAGRVAEAFDLSIARDAYVLVNLLGQS
jgi:hypothetical protein